MSSYTFQIRKSDHVNPNGRNDLHVHVYYNEGKSRKCIGRYRLPSLEPIFQKERELTERELEALRRWFAQPEQIHKLMSYLKDTLFDTHKIVRSIPAFSEVITSKDGETYINIRIPVSRRIK